MTVTDMRRLAILIALATTVARADVSGIGTGSFNVIVQPNLGPARSADIVIKDASGVQVGVSTVNQASGCGWLLVPQSAAFVIGGGGGAVAVTASDPACPAWTAKSNAGWISVPIASGASGSGMMTYTVGKNPGNSKARTGTITIAGQIFTVTQAGKR